MALYLSALPGNFYGPPSVLDPHYGAGLDADRLFHQPTAHHLSPMWHCPDGYLSPWKSASSEHDIGSTPSVHADKFRAILNVHRFKPGELTVKITGDNTVTIEGKHEEKKDDHGMISRHFVRHYKIPENCDINKVESKLSSDGILTIFAPKIETGDQESRAVPIIQTGQPAKGNKDKKEVENGTAEKEK